MEFHCILQGDHKFHDWDLKNLCSIYKRNANRIRDHNGPVMNRYETNMSREWLEVVDFVWKKEVSCFLLLLFFPARNMRACVYLETHFLLSQVKARRVGENVSSRFPRAIVERSRIWLMHGIDQQTRTAVCI